MDGEPKPAARWYDFFVEKSHCFQTASINGIWAGLAGAVIYALLTSKVRNVFFAAVFTGAPVAVGSRLVCEYQTKKEQQRTWMSQYAIKEQLLMEGTKKGEKWDDMYKDLLKSTDKSDNSS